MKMDSNNNTLCTENENFEGLNLYPGNEKFSTSVLCPCCKKIELEFTLKRDNKKTEYIDDSINAIVFCDECGTEFDLLDICFHLSNEGKTFTNQALFDYLEKEKEKFVKEYSKEEPIIKKAEETEIPDELMNLWLKKAEEMFPGDEFAKRLIKAGLELGYHAGVELTKVEYGLLETLTQ